MPPLQALSSKNNNPAPRAACAAPPKLACPENAALLQQLIDLRLRIARQMPGSHYYYTVQRALESLAKHPVPLRTYNELVAVKFVGPSIAKHLQLPNEDENKYDNHENNNTSKSNSNNPNPPKKRAKTNNKSSNTTKKKKKDTTIAMVSENPVAHRNDTAETTAAAEAASKGRKEALYEQAVFEAEHWKERVQSEKVAWRLVLLIDLREQWCEYMQAQCLLSGIPCESRALPIGDMMWIVQGFTKTTTSGEGATGEKEEILLELVCGTILERKTPEDLKQSIFGSRYMEQRLRLQNCGIPQIVYLIEGDEKKDLYACSMDTLHTAIWETRLLMDFSILHTAHADDTVQTLKRLHRRILQRTFPRTFQRTEALPHFRAALHEKRRTTSTTSATAGQRHRRERRQSLANWTFDAVDPTVPLGMPRFISYAELKAKIILDRERGTQSVQHLHLAMLKQVPTWYEKKCRALAAVHPTVHALCAALAPSSESGSGNPYRRTTLTTQQKIANCPLPSATTTTTTNTRTIGTRSAETLYLCYTGGGGGDIDEAEETTRNDTTVPIPPTVVAAVPATMKPVAAAPPTREASEIWCIDSDEDENDPPPRPVRGSWSSSDDSSVLGRVDAAKPAAVPRPSEFSQDVIDLLSD